MSEALPPHCPPPLSWPQVVEQPVLRAEARSALSLQGRQKFRPRRDVSRRGPPVPRQRHLGGPDQLQEEEARLQVTVSSWDSEWPLKDQFNVLDRLFFFNGIIMR